MQPLMRMRDEAWPVSISAQVDIETWELESPFIIARGRQDDIALTVVTLQSEGITGRGESCPVLHYGETPESVCKQIRAAFLILEQGIHWADLHDEMPAGAARNAVDCAVWDLVAKTSGKRVYEILGLQPPKTVETVYTLSVDTPENMAAAARNAGQYSKLKLKLGGGAIDCDRVRAIREAVPEKTLIADVNEYWTRGMLAEFLPVMAEVGLNMLEQPLKAGDDSDMDGIDRLVPVGADESCHVTGDLLKIRDYYDVVNIKLDKTGGLTEALRLKSKAEEFGLQTMTGCMLGTSLAMAPAHLIAQNCAYVDIDAPLLIGKDRPGGLHYNGGQVSASSPELWG